MVLLTHSRAHLEGLASAAAAFTLTYVEAEVVIAVTTEWILRRDYDNRLEVCPGSQNGSKPPANVAEMKLASSTNPLAAGRGRSVFLPGSVSETIHIRLRCDLEHSLFSSDRL